MRCDSKSLRLSVLRFGDPVPEAGSLTFDCVAIPGVGTPCAESWGLKSLLQDVGQDIAPISVINLYTFATPDLVAKSITPKNVSEWGVNLLSALKQHRGTGDGADNPIIFICHSLGVLLLKKLFKLDREQTRSRSLLGAIRGIVLLGCPNAHAKAREAWSGHMDILCHFSQSACKDMSDAEQSDEAQFLHDLSAQFNRAVEQIPLLLFLEEESTKVKVGFRTKTLKVSRYDVLMPIWREFAKLVDSSFAAMHSATTMELPLKHEDLGLFTCNKEARLTFSDWLEIHVVRADASGPSQISTDFNKIAVEVGLVDQYQVADIDTRRELIKAWLESGTVGPWLLIFDNADKLDILFDYLPARGHGAILVTSRDPEAKSHMSFAKAGIDLTPFSDEDGTDLLRKLVACDDTETEASASLQMFGAIKKRELSVHESLSMLDRDSKYAKFRSMDNAVQRKRYKSTLATAFNFDALTESTSDILKIIAVLHPDRIPEKLFEDIDVNINLDPANPTSMDMKHGDLAAFENARVELGICSMAKRDKRERVVSIRRVTAQEVRAQMSRDEMTEVLKRAVSLLTAKFLYSTLKNNPTSERWAAFSRNNLRSVVYQSKHSPRRSFYGKLEHTSENAVCQENEESSALLAAAYNQLGVAYTLNDDFAKAIELFRESIAAYRALENFHIDMLGFPVANLGLAQWVLGRYNEAEQTFNAALEEREAEFGVMDRLSYKTGRILYGYGNVLESKALVLRMNKGGSSVEAEGLMKRSYGLHKQGLTQIERNQGDNHHRIGDICHKLAGHHLRDGEYGRAKAYVDRAYVDRALGIWGHQTGYRNQICRTTFLKGKILIADGHEADGRHCIETARAMRRTILQLKIDDVDVEEEDFDRLVVFWCRGFARRVTIAMLRAVH
ncbi:Hypothetical protein D9617_10g071900 [Elsinoe fawcettii]|nr:Hypothetical protein D9617_10g071900 [Elsinoe fawcettii]